MRRPAQVSHVTFAARILRDEKNILENLLPMQGGGKWAAEVALEEFIGLCEHNAPLQQWCHEQIENAKLEGPPRGADDFQPRVRRDLYERFNKMFGEKGATSWFLRQFVTALINEADKQPLPEEIVKRAVRQMLNINSLV